MAAVEPTPARCAGGRPARTYRDPDTGCHGGFRRQRYAVGAHDTNVRLRWISPAHRFAVRSRCSRGAVAGRLTTGTKLPPASRAGCNARMRSHAAVTAPICAHGWPSGRSTTHAKRLDSELLTMWPRASSPSCFVTHSIIEAVFPVSASCAGAHQGASSRRRIDTISRSDDFPDQPSSRALQQLRDGRKRGSAHRGGRYSDPQPPLFAALRFAAPALVALILLGLWSTGDGVRRAAYWCPRRSDPAQLVADRVLLIDSCSSR